jgi:hypothetical protein
LTSRTTIDDNPAADAGADEDAEHVPGLGFQFGDVDAEGADVAIVLHEHGHAELLFEVLLERCVFPALEVRREDDTALGKVHRAGSAHADAGNLLESEVGFIHRLLGAAGDPLDDGLNAARGLGA